MTWLPMTFAVWNLSTTYNLKIKRDSTTVYLHLNWKADMAYDLSVIVKNEPVLKIIGCHVHFKCGNI